MFTLPPLPSEGQGRDEALKADTDEDHVPDRRPSCLRKTAASTPIIHGCKKLLKV